MSRCLVIYIYIYIYDDYELTFKEHSVILQVKTLKQSNAIGYYDPVIWS